MSMAEITEGSSFSNNCIPTRSLASDVNACSSLYVKVGTSIARKKKIYIYMSAHTGEENHKHSVLKMMTRAQCYNKADTTWHILWGLSSCAFLFPSQRRAATEISLIPTKHLCHKINTSQNCLSTRKDSGSSVLIFLFYSVFVFFLFLFSSGVALLS